MVTTAFCVRGYWLMGRLKSDLKPSTTISKLTTEASTGLRMKMSVKFMGGPQCSWGVGLGLLAGKTLLSTCTGTLFLSLIWPLVTT